MCLVLVKGSYIVDAHVAEWFNLCPSSLGNKRLVSCGEKAEVIIEGMSWCSAESIYCYVFLNSWEGSLRAPNAAFITLSVGTFYIQDSDRKTTLQHSPEYLYKGP